MYINWRKIARYANYYKRFINFDVAHEIAGLSLLVSFGIKCEGLKHGDNISYYLYPRSSISNTPLRMSNSVGIIDAGYRGNIMAALDNHSDEPYVIKKGTRLFQICCPILSQINMKVVDELSDTSRDTGGFGSTGKWFGKFDFTIGEVLLINYSKRT